MTEGFSRFRLGYFRKSSCTLGSNSTIYQISKILNKGTFNIFFSDTLEMLHAFEKQQIRSLFCHTDRPKVIDNRR